jgi:hypothetical protein
VDIRKSLRSIPAGAGGMAISPSGLLFSSSTVVGTTAVTTEETLWTETLPINTLTTAGKVLRIRAGGRFGATANTKTVRLYFGTTVVVTITGAHNNLAWSIEVDIRRVAADTYVAMLGRSQVGATMALGLPGSLNAESDASPIVLKVTGQNGTAAVNDSRIYGMTVEFL